MLKQAIACCYGQSMRDSLARQCTWGYFGVNRGMELDIDLSGMADNFLS